MGMRKGPLVLIVLLVLVMSAIPLPPVGSTPTEASESRADVTLPVSHRPFMMGVGPHPKNLPTPTWDEVMEGYETAGRWGELSNYWPGVPWYEEDDKMVDNASTRATVQTLYTDNGMAPVFQTNFWNLLTRPGYGFGAWLDVPPDRDPNVTLADTEFRSRWVDHVSSVAEEWQMEYYCIGNEVNSYHGWHPENAADFEANLPSLMAESYTAIKEVSPDTRVVITFRLVELLDRDDMDLLELFNATTCDVIAFTSYPSLTGEFDTPADLPDDYYYRICDHTGTMPLAIAELGWTSHAAYGGDEGEQADFLTWFLEHTADIPWEYVQWLELHDLRAEGAATAHSQTVGLLRNDGTAKPAWEVWKGTFNLSYSRGWEHIPRGPIWIIGNANFTSDNGVRDGSGTMDDPFIIRGWDINGSGSSYCLSVWNVTAHFIVQDVHFHDCIGTGVRLNNVMNGALLNSTIERCLMGLIIDSSSKGIEVLGNAFIDGATLAKIDGTEMVLDRDGKGNFWDDYHIKVRPFSDHDGITWSGPYKVSGEGMVFDNHPLVHRPGHVPVILEDHSQEEASTGDVFTFSVFSPEERGFPSARVFTYVGRDRYIISDLQLIESAWGSLWLGNVTIPSYAIEPIVYFFVMRGPDGNLTFSNVTHIPVVDNDPPWIVRDVTPSEVSFEQDLTFEVDVTDNVGISGVRVEYWYEDEGPFNLSMEESVTDRWVHTIPVAAGLGDLYYRFHIEDTSGNWNSSQITTLSLNDTTPPVFGNDTTTPEGFTGDPVVFQVVVTDDVAVHNVTVEYGTLEGYYYGMAEMDADGDSYTHELVVPSYVVGTLSYRFIALDTSGNNATSEVAGIIIEDDDPPSATVVSTLPPTVGTGESHQVVVNVDDNVGVWSVTFYMELDTGEGDPLLTPVNLLDMGGSFQGTVHLPSGQVGTITHHMTVTDLYNNSVNTVPGVSQLVDTIAPEMETPVPVTTKLGKTVYLEVTATDNIGIAEVTWKGLPFKADGMYANGTFDEPGEHKVTVTVRDAAGNVATDDFIVFVEDDVDPTTVMLQVLLGMVLAKWMLARRSRESRGDPELEDAPDDEVPEQPLR